MLFCSKCNNHQDDGKFCGVCGGALEEKIDTEQSNASVEPLAGNASVNENTEQETVRSSPNEGAAQQATNAPVNENIRQGTVNLSANEEATTTEAQAQPTTEALKDGLSNYWSYFINLIKNPARAFHTGEHQFVNSLITLGLYALLFSLSLYFLINSLASALLDSSFGASIPFFEMVSKLIFMVVILFVISFGSAFAMSKLGKNQESFKTMITQYASIVVPFTALNVVAMLGGLMSSIQLTLFSLSLSIMFTFIFIPLLFVYEKVSAVNKNGQQIYLSLATVVLISLITYLLGDALIVNLLSYLENIVTSSFIW